MIDERLLREAERQFGVPYDLDLSFDVDVGEYDMVIGSMKDSRSDDVTFFNDVMFAASSMTSVVAGELKSA